MRGKERPCYVAGEASYQTPELLALVQPLRQGTEISLVCKFFACIIEKREEQTCSRSPITLENLVLWVHYK